MNDYPVTRREFEAAMRRIEAVLEKQTDILQSLARGEAENAARDEKISALQTEARALRDEQASQRDRLAWYAGALAVVVSGIQLLGKKLGFL